ncbi:MAG: hypothetical protein ACFNTM_06380, partial [Cardiobacterium sp.]
YSGMYIFVWTPAGRSLQQGGLYCKQPLGRIAVKLRQPENRCSGFEQNRPPFFRLLPREAPLRYSNAK